MRRLLLVALAVVTALAFSAGPWAARSMAQSTPASPKVSANNRPNDTFVSETVLPMAEQKTDITDDLIMFDPSTCDFGEQLKPHFAKASETTPHPEADLTEEILYPIDMDFRGLRVKYLVVGYEWNGLTFADAPAKVQAVFRGLGHQINEDGSFVMSNDTEIVATLTAPKAGHEARGATELICGI